jgi:hypothetical protein
MTKSHQPGWLHRIRVGLPDEERASGADLDSKKKGGKTLVKREMEKKIEGNFPWPHLPLL